MKFTNQIKFKNKKTRTQQKKNSQNLSLGFQRFSPIFYCLEAQTCSYKVAGERLLTRSFTCCHASWEKLPSLPSLEGERRCNLFKSFCRQKKNESSQHFVAIANEGTSTEDERLPFRICFKIKFRIFIHTSVLSYLKSVHIKIKD